MQFIFSIRNRKGFLLAFIRVLWVGEIREECGKEGVNYTIFLLRFGRYNSVTICARSDEITTVGSTDDGCADGGRCHKEQLAQNYIEKATRVIKRKKKKETVEEQMVPGNKPDNPTLKPERQKRYLAVISVDKQTGTPRRNQKKKKSSWLSFKARQFLIQ